eukprot:GCRY01000693.1.p1 GENE.GCRY01000693.1~~GCRY01000693.1.p1  ORF type:complete len:316 (-),score=56.48 GCRY01000693.1:80-1027(-)
MELRASQYHAGTTGDSSSPQELTQQVSAELRSHIRRLAAYPVFSPEWYKMNSSLSHIATVCHIENNVTQASFNRNKSTLWEREELAVRFLLEEGKLNLCLRSLIDFKKFQKEFLLSEDTREEVLAKANLPADEAISQCKEFEKSMGILLAVAYCSIECLQTTDMAMLIQYIGEVINNAVGYVQYFEDKENILKNQELLVFKFLLSISSSMEELNEEKIMEEMHLNHIIPLTVSFLKKYSGLDWMFAFFPLQALSLIFETESFKTHRDKMFESEDVKKEYVAVIDDILPTIETSLQIHIIGAKELFKLFKRQLKIK